MSPRITRIDTDNEEHTQSIYGRLAIIDKALGFFYDSMSAQQHVQSRIAGIILAGGRSSRMGRVKQLLPWRGTTLLGSVLALARRSRLDKLVLVLGCASEAILQTVDLQGAQVIVNPDYAQGQSTSLQAGLGALPEDIQAAVFLLGDQPLVTAAIIDLIISTYTETKAPLVIPVHAGRRGNPVLIHCSLFPELRALEGDTGARVMFERYADSICEVPVLDNSICRDIDTWEDYQELIGEGS